ncbi:MAG: Uma2 family endonuclease [Blastococcus sp.]
MAGVLALRPPVDVFAGTRVDAVGDAVLVVPQTRASFTVADLDRLPDDGNCYEVLDGRLLVTPPPSAEHGWVAGRLVRVLDAAAPAGLAVRENINLAVENGVPTPDVVVFRPRFPLPAALDPADVLLVAEVVSRGHARVDHEMKRAAYQAAGIGHYLLVDRNPPRVTVLRLVEGRFQQVAAGPFVSLADPFPVVIDAAGLLR